MKSGFWIIIVILALGLGYWAGYDVASKPPKQVTVIKEVAPAAQKGESADVPAESGGYGVPAAPAESGGYGAPAAPAASGGYGAPAAPAASGGYGAPAAPAASGGYGAPASSGGYGN